LRLEYCLLYFKHSTTAVIRKPQKDNYTIPKAYQPIALLNTISKLIEGIIAKRISYITEIHQLLPGTYIGGCKGRSTDYTIYIIIEKIYNT
jgi:hypothetical protein